MSEESLYVVKVRRQYGEHEATSVLRGLLDLSLAEKYLEDLIAMYQDPDAYYIEEWRA